MICIAKSQSSSLYNQLLSARGVLAALVVLGWTISSQCQDVEIRASNGADKADGAIRSIGGSSARTVYSPRLSYGQHHQIMHFGKRPTIPLPSRVYDLFYQQQNQQPLMTGNKLPWFQQASNIEPLEEDMTAFEFPDPIQQDRMPIYSIITPAATPSARSPMDSNQFYSSNALVNRFLQSAANGSQGKFSRLMNSDSDNQSGSNSDDTDSDQSSTSDQQQPTGNINVATRSPHSTNSRISNQSPFGSKNYISTLLLGRASTPSLGANFGSFIKKAEPKDNVFMHFGRK